MHFLFFVSNKNYLWAEILKTRANIVNRNIISLSEVRSRALRALTIVIYDRRSLKVLTIYDPRYRENASTTYDLRSLPFLTIRDLRSMTFQLTIDDLSPFVRFTIYGSRGSIRGLRSTIFASSKNKQSFHIFRPFLKLNNDLKK